jgi:hypothetical protein
VTTTVADAPAAGQPGPPAAAGTAALSDVMLAMDVVDTLRHADAQVARELSEGDRSDELRRRLREIYAAQGIEVPDRILEEGIKGISEARFAYAPTPPSWQRTVAGLWVSRAKWLRPALAGLAVALVVSLAWHFGVRQPQLRRVAAEQVELVQTIPRAAAGTVERINAIATEAAAREEAARLQRDIAAAVNANDLPAARDRQVQLQALLAELAQAYRIRIVQRPGEPSGLWRVPAANPRAQNYYLIVEAVDPQGRVVPVRVTSEETRRTAEVSRWGLRVPQEVFEAVRRDKQDDGIIQNDIVGEKRIGERERHWRIDTTGAAILEW